MDEFLIELKAHHYGAPGKDRITDMGLAIDAAVKEQVEALGAVIQERFAPFDYELNGIPHEIKSSAGTWLSIPNSEIEFAQDRLSEGIDVVYVIAQQVDLRLARLLGQVRFSQFTHLIEPSKFLTWRNCPSGWVQERSHRVLLSKLMPLLT